MKVRKMVETLSKMVQENPNSDVKLHGLHGESALFICKKKGDETIWIQSESDVDMKAELDERFRFIENHDNESKKESIQTMLDTGMDPFMVSKYLGKKDAIKMITYCAKFDLLSNEEINEALNIILNNDGKERA